MTSNSLLASAKNNLRLIALSFNPENEDHTKENCKEQIENVLKSAISDHKCYPVTNSFI